MEEQKEAVNSSEHGNGTKNSDYTKKPKAVFHCDDNLLENGELSDDENIILHLQVVKTVATDGPDAYNEGHANAFESKPFDLTAVAEESSVPQLQPTVTGNAGQPSSTFADDDRTSTSNLKVVDLLRDFEEKTKCQEWPRSTNVCCYWCCHPFDTEPFGLPIKFNGSAFSVTGCFCSPACASAYNFASLEGMDEIWERNSLLNLMVTKMGLMANAVKPAPNRLMLRMFGGSMDIKAFRAFCDTAKAAIVNFPPMVAMTQQVEEVFESDIACDYRYVPLDNARVNRYKEKLRLRRSKPLSTVKNTLDQTMNLHIQPSS